MGARSVLDGMPARLLAARDHVRDALVALENARLLRNRAIVDAVDGGMSQSQVALYAGIGQPGIVKVLAKPDDVAMPA
jgi:hypothetical protein